MYLFSDENILSVNKMVAVSLELCVQETLKRSGGPNSAAFQVHSAKLDNSEQPMPFLQVSLKDEMNRGAMNSMDMSNSYLEKNLLGL